MDQATLDQKSIVLTVTVAQANVLLKALSEPIKDELNLIAYINNTAKAQLSPPPEVLEPELEAEPKSKVKK